MRKTYEELNQLKKKYKVDTLWSWSRYHIYKQDTWEYLLKYIQHIKEDRVNSIYCVSGGDCHSILERFYEGKIKYEDMITEYEDQLLTMNIADLKYDRSDSEKNDKIANKYETCIKHFFTHHQVIKHSNKIEQFIIIKIGKNIFNGYIDFLHTEEYTNNSKQIVITDWKTSSIYKGQKIDEECGQLLLYAEGIRQTLHLPLENIKIRWNFMKYINVNCLQANGKWKERQIERNSIGEKLSSNARMWLKRMGYEQEQVDTYISDMILDNSIDNLPQEIQDKFVISDCYVYIPLTEEKIQSLKDDIIKTIDEIQNRTKQYYKLKDSDIDTAEHIFWQDVTQSDSYRLAVLSGYSRKYHKPYDEYLKEQEMFEDKNKDDKESVSNGNLNNNKDNIPDEDLSWLDEL